MKKRRNANELLGFELIQKNVIIHNFQADSKKLYRRKKAFNRFLIQVNLKLLCEIDGENRLI